MTNQEMKIAFVTGGTGGIGEAVIRELADTGKWRIVTAVRRHDDAKKMYEGLPVDVVQIADLGDQKLVNGMVKGFREKEIIFDAVLLTAGSFEWDNDMRQGEKMKSADQVAKDLYHANFLTKETIWNAFDEYYKDILKNIKTGIVGSHAATFAPENPLRVNAETGYKQEGYFFSMEPVSVNTKWLAEKNIYKNVFLYEAPLIDTPMARRQFTKETVGKDPDWRFVTSPKQAGHTLLAGTGLL
jgi:nucleoside-diphosphate-sugar epimerase